MEKKGNSMKILFCLAPKKFRDEEYERCRIKFEDAGFQVDVVTEFKKKAAEGMLDSKVKPDFSLIDLDPAPYQAVCFLGGEGAKMLWDHPLAKSLAQTFHFTGKPISAIGLGVGVLARAGILKNSEASCPEEMREEFQKFDCQYRESSVMQDKNIITATGHQESEEFCKLVIQAAKLWKPKES